jgi:hypothetical protein
MKQAIRPAITLRIEDFTMTNIRTFMFAALAVIVAFGAGGRQALAEAPHFHLSVIGHVPAQVSPDPAAPTIFQLVTNFGTLAPIDGSGNDEWPCYTGDPINWPDCSSIPAGGLVIGVPTYTVSLANCLDPNVACIGGEEVVEDDNPSTTEAFKWALRITQGDSIILDTGKLNFGPNMPNTIQVIGGNLYVGPGNCATGTCVAPVAGQATATTWTWVGKSVAVGHATINFQ